MQIDYKKLATLGGYKTPASANASWLTVKKKLLAATGINGNAAKGSPEEGANDDLADDEATPLVETPKKQRGGRKPKAAINGTGVQLDDSEGLDGIPKPKKRARKQSNSTGGPAAKRAKKDIVKEEEKGDGLDEEDDDANGAVVKNEPVEDDDGAGAEGVGEDTVTVVGMNTEVDGDGEFQQQTDMIGA